MIRRSLWSALTVVCIVRVYRGPQVSTYVDDGQGTNTLRPQTVGECVGSAVIEGAMLATGICNGLKAAWK
jgi:hypothetical protein